MAIARHMHDDYDENQDPMKLERLIDFFAMHFKKVKRHTIREIHFNPKNWKLIKFLPHHLRYISYRDEKGKWIRPLFCKLKNDPSFPSYTEYVFHCCAVVGWTNNGNPFLAYGNVH